VLLLHQFSKNTFQYFYLVAAYLCKITELFVPKKIQAIFTLLVNPSVKKNGEQRTLLIRLYLTWSFVVSTEKNSDLKNVTQSLLMWVSILSLWSLYI